MDGQPGSLGTQGVQQNAVELALLAADVGCTGARNEDNPSQRDPSPNDKMARPPVEEEGRE